MAGSGYFLIWTQVVIDVILCIQEFFALLFNQFVFLWLYLQWLFGILFFPFNLFSAVLQSLPALLWILEPHYWLPKLTLADLNELKIRTKREREERIRKKKKEEEDKKKKDDGGDSGGNDPIDPN